MDILEETSGVETAPVDLHEITAVDMPPLQIPAGTIRNKAAVSAMLSGNPDVSSAYQGMVAEGEAGKTVQADQVVNQFKEASGKLDMQALMGVLSDPKLSYAQKQGAVNAIKEGSFNFDSRTALISKTLSDGSEGETADNEDARLSTADLIKQLDSSTAERQALVNAHGAQLASMSDSGARVTVDALETILAPFGQGITSYKYAKALAEKEGRTLSFYEGLKAGTFGAGTVKADIRKKLEQLSPTAQVEYTKSLLDVIKNSSSIIAPTDNQFNQFVQAVDIVGQGGYGKVNEFVDNAVFLLDLIGVGQLMRGASKAHSVAKELGKQPLVFETALLPPPLASRKGDVQNAVIKRETTTVSATTPQDLAQTAPPLQGVNDSIISAKQDEIAELLGEAGNLAGKGDIAQMKRELSALTEPTSDAVTLKARTREIQKTGKSYKEAAKLAEKEVKESLAEHSAKVSRLTSQIETNRISSTVSQRIDELEKEISQLQKTNVDELAKNNPIADVIKRMEQNSVVRKENPASVASVVQQTNPAKARAIHEAIVKSEGDTVAEALTGVGKEQAMANDVMPQVVTESGSVTAKVNDIDRNLRINPELAASLRDLVKSSDTGIHFTMEELKAGRANVINDFSNATDLVPSDAMGGFKAGFKENGSGLEISAVYGTKNGAFSNAQQAADQATYALRNEGVLPSDITIMKKQGMDYVPTTLAAEEGKVGSYLVQVRMDRELIPPDMIDSATKASAFNNLDVKRNTLDRIPGLQWTGKGTASRWIMDASSMLHPQITGPAVVGADISSMFEKTMLEMATKFSDQFNKLEKTRQIELEKYLKEANFKEIAFDVADLTTRGFNPAEIATARAWRDFWDAHWFLENNDLVRTLNNQGYQIFSGSGDNLFGKAISKNQNIGSVYNPSSGRVEVLTKVEHDLLYAQGGTVAKLRRPADFPSPGGITTRTEYMIVRNSPTEYLRKLRDTDMVVNKRDGYYQINYTAPRFVDEITKSASGAEESRRAVAVGGDTAEVKHFANRQNALKNGKEYVIRDNDRGMARGADDWFDVNSASGRIAQRYRGKLLEDATGINHLGDGNYILSPIESAVRAAQSISGRTVMRPVLETAKARFLEQYAAVLPSNGMGGRKFPKDFSEIGAKGVAFSKEIADARTTFEYIHSLENGYINSLDNFVKNAFNVVATMAGEHGLSKLERAALMGTDKSLTSGLKGTVFISYIALNPIRQWIVQTNQVMRTLAFNPKGWASGDIPFLMVDYMASKVNPTFKPSKQGQLFIDFVDKQGFLDAVDKQNLVRGSLMETVTGTTGAAKWFHNAVESSRKIGFDVGESMNLLGHAAAVFDKRARDGLGLTSQRDRGEMHSLMRAISYDMNFSGDMVYNQTSAAFALQFLQVPHKAWLQATNRRIPVSTTRNMMIADMMIWGPPVGLIGTIFGINLLTDDETINSLMTDGLEAVLLNTILDEMSSSHKDIDFESLGPYGASGWGKVFMELAGGGGPTAIAINSPAGQVFLKDSGRVQSAVRSMARWFNPWTDIERTPETALATILEVAKISSGVNNAVAARQMFSLGKALDKEGIVLEEGTTNTEALAKVFGFTSKNITSMYATMIKEGEKTKAYQDEVKASYKIAKQYYQNMYAAGINDPKQSQAVIGQMLIAYKDSPIALEIINREFIKDMSGKNNQLLNQMIKSTELPTRHITEDSIKQSGASPEVQQQLINRLRDAENARIERNKGE